MKSIERAFLVFKLLALFVCTVNAEADAFSINNPFDKHGTEANLLSGAVYPIIILAILQPVVIILLIKALKKNQKIIRELQEGKIKHQTLFESMKEGLVSLNKELTATYALRDKVFMVLCRDIREPLATLVNLTELLVEDKDLYTSENLEILNEIQEYVSNVFANVEILLRWFESKKSRDIYAPLNWGLSELLQEALEMLKLMLEAKNISVVSEIQYETKVYADKEMLGLVFRNLLSNAIKFMGRNESILIASELEKEMVVVSFKDSGVGIAAEKVQLLFQDVNGKATEGTEGETGLGLGLFLCRQLIQRNGGDIWLESTAGEGSTFYISIPSACPKK